MTYPIHTREDSKCRDCYRCLRNCALKAIRFDGGRAKIIANKCVLCGECVHECPQETKVVTGDFVALRKALTEGQDIALSVGETGIIYFRDRKLNDLIQDIEYLGFKNVELADRVEPAMQRFFADRLKSKRDFVISSHCPVVVNLIEYHYPHLIEHLLPAPTQAAVHAADLKARFPNTKVAHVTECIAELNNERSREHADYIITFPELSRLLQENMKETPYAAEQDISYKGGYAFSLSGQMVRKMQEAGVEQEGTTESFSGMETCIDILNHLGDSDRAKIGFLELMACESGCVNGYGLREIGSVMDRSLSLTQFEKDRHDLPEAVLKRDLKDSHVGFVARPYHQAKVRCSDVSKEFKRFFGQESMEMLDCAACGYDSCYEKTEAVVRGDAEREMCMSYLRRYAESYASSIVESSVNGLIVFNKALKILEINPMAKRLFQSYHMKLGDNLDRYFDPDIFKSVVRTGEVVRAHNLYLEEVELYLQLYVMPLSVMDTYLTIIVDITGIMLQRQELEDMKADLLEKAEKVIDHQMQSAQEIARLLGETTAETKITLLELMNLDK